MKKVILTIFIIFIFISIFAFPVKDYNFYLPNTNISPYALGLGGICLTQSENNLAFVSNPALLGDVKQMTFTASFLIPSTNKTFTQMLSQNPILEKSNFRGFGIQAQKIGVLYQELANINETDISDNFKTYQDYKLRSFGLSFADTTQSISLGLSFKYLDGRLVYLNQRKTYFGDRLDSLYITEEFIDSKSRGFASDIGIYGQRGAFHFGFMVNDLFSKLYWKDYDQVKIKTRGNFSVELKSNSIALASGVSSLWNIHEQALYSQSINYSAQLSNPNLKQSVSLRFGATSKDYKESKNILYSFGTSYMIQTFKIDLSMQTRGLKSNTAQYAFSLSVGE